MAPPYSAHLFLIYNELVSHLLPAETKFKPYNIFLLLVLQSIRCREEAASPFRAIFLNMWKFICLHASLNTQSKNKVKH